MRMKFFKRLALLSAVLCLVAAFATGASAAEGEARDITSDCTVETDGFQSSVYLTNKSESSGAMCQEGGTVTVTAPESIGSVYMIFNSDVTPWTIESAGGSITCGQDGFLHEYVDIAAAFGETKELRMRFPAGYNISEIYVFSAGEKPDWVQTWLPPTDRADLLLYSAHSDDDQLYFAGLIPYYTALGYRVQVAYFTYHPNEVYRRHELLNGLWTAGAVYYPIYAKTYDFRVDNLTDTINTYANHGDSYEELEEIVITTIRRVKPLVVVSHDTKGEYGHGMHRLISKLVCDAVADSPDAEKFPESAEKYGVWTVPKTYLHLYPENQIVLDIDTPLAALDGQTPFQVSQQAFRKHPSQHDSLMYGWLYGSGANPITLASQISTYNPAHFGLYASEVGPDTGENDMFENLLSYEEAASLRETLNARQAEHSGLEARLAEAEEEIAALNARLDGEAETNQKTVAEKDAEISQLKSDQDGLNAQLEKTHTLTILLAAATAVCVLVTALVCMLRRRSKKPKKHKYLA